MRASFGGYLAADAACHDEGHHDHAAGDRLDPVVVDVAERGADLAGDLRDAAREKVEPLRRAVTRG